MLTNTNKYEYAYEDSNAVHNHAYILLPILELISKQKINTSQKLRVLDLGCGNGCLTHVIAQQGYEVVGLEDSVSGIAIARQNFPSCEFINASIYDLPTAKLLKAFDVVISVDVIEHLLYPRELLKLARKCLKPRGLLITTTPYHGYLKNIVLALLGKMDTHFDPLWDGGHIKFFSVKTLTQMIEQEGYTNISYQFAGRFPYLWKSMLCSAFLAEK